MRSLSIATVLTMSLHIGWNVDGMTGGATCTANNGDWCRHGTASGKAGGFDYPSSVASNLNTGDLYVADLDNYRVEEFTPSGVFVSMFGWDVNARRSALGRSSRERNVCAADSRDFCDTGEPGSHGGQLVYPQSIAVDPFTGDVYVLEIANGNYRVDRYTTAGRFVWVIGKRVNVARSGNICRASEVQRLRVKCASGRRSATGSLEHAAFKFPQQEGNLLAAGGPDDLLFVGDEQRVQEFDAAGKWRREIALASVSSAPGSSVTAVAVTVSGELYLVYRVAGGKVGSGMEQNSVVRRFNQKGEQVGEFSVTPRLANAIVDIDGIAIEAAGRIAVIGVEVGVGLHQRFGYIYDGATGDLIGRFSPPTDNDGLTFNSHGDLYVAATDDQEVVGYVPGPVSQLLSEPVPCEIAPADDFSAAFECALATAGG